MRRAPRKSRQAPNGKAEAMTALVMHASKKNSIFSTMSAYSLGSEDERAASYGAMDKVSAFLAPLQLSSLRVLLCHSASYIARRNCHNRLFQ